MSDITKCKGKGCTAKKHCHRYTAKASERQSYFLDEPFEIHGKSLTCDMYWANKEAPDTTVIFS